MGSMTFRLRVGRTDHSAREKIQKAARMAQRNNGFGVRRTRSPNPCAETPSAWPKETTHAASLDYSAHTPRRFWQKKRNKLTRVKYYGLIYISMPHGVRSCLLRSELDVAKLQRACCEPTTCLLRSYYLPVLSLLSQNRRTKYSGNI